VKPGDSFILINAADPVQHCVRDLSQDKSINGVDMGIIRTWCGYRFTMNQVKPPTGQRECKGCMSALLGRKGAPR